MYPRLQTTRIYTPLPEMQKGEDSRRIPFREPIYRGESDRLASSTQAGRSVAHLLVMQQAKDGLHAALGKALDFAKGSTNDADSLRKIEVQRRLNMDKEPGRVVRALDVLRKLGVDMSADAIKDVEAAFAKYRSCLDPQITAQRKKALEHLSATMQKELNAALQWPTLSEKENEDLKLHLGHIKLQDDQLPSRAANARMYLEQSLTLPPETIEGVNTAIKEAELAIEKYQSIGLVKSRDGMNVHAKSTKELFDAVLKELADAESLHPSIKEAAEKYRAKLNKNCNPKEAQEQAREALDLWTGMNGVEVANKRLNEAIAKHATATGVRDVSKDDPQKHAKDTQELLVAVEKALAETEVRLQPDNPLHAKVQQYRTNLKKDCPPKEAQEQAAAARDLVEQLGDTAPEVVTPLSEAITKHALVTTPQNDTGDDTQINAKHTKELFDAVEKALTDAETLCAPGKLAGAEEFRAKLKKNCDLNEAQEQALEAQLLVEQLGDPAADILNPLKAAIAKHASVTTPQIDTDNDDQDDDEGPEKMAARMLDSLREVVTQIASVTPVFPPNATRAQVQESIRKSLEALGDEKNGLYKYFEEAEKTELATHLQQLADGTEATEEHLSEALDFVTGITQEYAKAVKGDFEKAFEKVCEDIPEGRRNQLRELKDALLKEIDELIGTPPADQDEAKDDTADSGKKPKMLKEIEEKTKWLKQVEAAEQAFAELQMVISFAKKVRDFILQMLR
jgi:hypothetical protein